MTSISPFLPWALCSLSLVGRFLPVSPMYTLPHAQGILYTPGLESGSCLSLWVWVRLRILLGAVWKTFTLYLDSARWILCEVLPKYGRVTDGDSSLGGPWVWRPLGSWVLICPLE